MPLLWKVTLLTGVFPFDVGQVGRAGVADGQTLLGHSLVSVHVHEISWSGDLEAPGADLSKLDRPWSSRKAVHG